MGQVNSAGESRTSERAFEPPAPAKGAQPSAKNDGIPGLQRPDWGTQRLSPKGILAEEEELSSNPLSVRFQKLSMTYNLMD